MTYANTPLENNPTGLFKTLKAIEKWDKDNNCLLQWKTTSKKIIQRIPLHWKTNSEKIIKRIIELKEAPFSKDVKEKIEELISRQQASINAYKLGRPKNPFTPDDKIDLIALLSVFWGNVSGCRPLPAFPFPRDHRSCVWRRNLFDTKTVKCYECDQKYFLFILEEIFQGKELAKIPGMDELIHSIPPIENTLKLTYDKRGKEIIQRDQWESPQAGNLHFPNFFNGAVTKSLIHFLAENDRRRIKKCPICKNYFYAKDLKREYCPPPKDCEKIRKRKYNQRFMKEKRDKKGPKFDPKYL